MESVKDFRITLDKALNFKLHISKMLQKERRILGFIIGSSGNFRNIRTLEILYKMFKYYPTDESYQELLGGFEILSLQKRRTITSLLFLIDILYEAENNGA